MPERRDAAALAAGLATVVVWGSAFVAIRSAGRELAPGAVALGRLVVATALLTGVALIRREPLPPRDALARIALFGVLWLGVYSIALNAAEREVDAGTSAMVVNIGPLLIAVLAGVFLGEGFPRRLFGGCAVALAGCSLIALAAGSRAGGAHGLALLVVATLAYAAAVVVQKTALSRAGAFQVTWLGCAAATVACLPLAATFPAEVRGASGGALAWTAYLGVFPTAVGFAAWSFALRHGTAGRAAALNYLIPVVAVLLGWAWLHERPAGLALAGGGICLTGVALARTRRGGRRSNLRPRSRPPRDESRKREASWRIASASPRSELEEPNAE